MASTMNWRTINIDLLDPDSAANFDTSTLTPAVAPVSASEIQSLAGQIRQLLRAGDAEGALRGALENAPYGGDSHTKDTHLASVVEILQSIKQSEMSPILRRIYESDGGSALLDVLMKYLYAPSPRVPAPLQEEQPPPRGSLQPHSNFLTPDLPSRRYKGMSHTPAPSTHNHNHASSTTRSSMSPQSTGFSQIHARSGGEGGGQAMSVLLSWHEKVVEIAGAGSVVRTMTDRRTV